MTLDKRERTLLLVVCSSLAICLSVLAIQRGISPEWFTVLFTAVLTGATILMWWEMSRTLAQTKRSVDTLQETSRGRLIIDGLSIVRTPNPVVHRMGYRIWNYGTTGVILRHLAMKHEIVDGDFIPQRASFPTSVMGNSYVPIGPGEKLESGIGRDALIEHWKEFTVDMNEFQAFHKQSKFLFIRGYLIYETAFGVRYLRVFNFKYLGQEGREGLFQAWPHDNMNYERPLEAGEWDLLMTETEEVVIE